MQDVRDMEGASRYRDYGLFNPCSEARRRSLYGPSIRL